MGDIAGTRRYGKEQALLEATKNGKLWRAVIINVPKGHSTEMLSDKNINSLR